MNVHVVKAEMEDMILYDARIWPLLHNQFGRAPHESYATKFANWPRSSAFGSIIYI